MLLKASRDSVSIQAKESVTLSITHCSRSEASSSEPFQKIQDLSRIEQSPKIIFWILEKAFHQSDVFDVFPFKLADRVLIEAEDLGSLESHQHRRVVGNQELAAFLDLLVKKDHQCHLMDR